MASKSDLEARIRELLADPQAEGSPMRESLALLWLQYQELVRRIERIARVSDAYQSIALKREATLSERLDKQLRQLEKVARISDRYQQMMRDLNIALKEASTHDALTGLANRRLLVERLKEETERCRRYARTFSIVMVDVDHFKDVNDHYGHELGDRALSEIARTMDAELREQDLCGRWGGEEFLVLLPETALSEAQAVVERIRLSVRELVVRADTEQLHITVSIGVAQHHSGENYSNTVNRADKALFEAKRSGRDRVVLAGSE